MLYFLKGLSITHMDDTGDSDDGNTFITRMFIRHGLHTPYCAGCVCLSFPVRKFSECLYFQLPDSFPTDLPIHRHLLMRPKTVIQQRVKLQEDIPFPILQQEMATILSTKP